MRLNIISQVWPKWYEVSKTVESKPSKNHLDSIWRVDQSARNMLWCIRSLFRRRENLTFNRPRLTFSDTTIMRIIGQAHRTWAELRAILRNDERNAASMMTFCGVGCGLVFVWVKRMSRQGFEGYMHSVELHKEVVVCENTFFCFWMAVFWVAMFWSWLPMFFGFDCRCLTICFEYSESSSFWSEAQQNFNLRWGCTSNVSFYQVSFSGLRNSWAFTKSQRRIYIRSRQDMRSFLLPTQNCFRLAG